MIRTNLIVKKGIFNGIDSIGVIGPFDQMDGQIDVLTEEIVNQGKKDIVFDFKETIYITSSGVAMLIKVLKRVQSAGGKFYIANITQDMYDLLANAALDRIIQFI